MYEIKIIDPFLKQHFLKAGISHSEEDEKITFSFPTQEEFIDVSTSFVLKFILNYTFNAIVEEGICTEEDKEGVFGKLSKNKIEFLLLDVFDKLKKVLDEEETNHTFDFISFFLSGLIPERKKMKNLFYEATSSFFSSSQPITLLDTESKADFIYFVVEENGSIRILDKSSNEISRHPFSQQEDAVAQVCFLNPDSLAVYDPSHLLNPELVICFKQLLGKKVTFLETPFPHYQT